MLQRINELLNLEVDFAFETTLTTLSYIQTIRLAKEKGYTITLLFFWLYDVNLAIERVKMRVSEGGHNIPEEVIKRRYYRGIQNLMTKFIDLCDFWFIINNSSRHFTFVAEGKGNIEIKIHDNPDWQKMLNQTNEKK